MLILMFKASPKIYDKSGKIIGTLKFFGSFDTCPNIGSHELPTSCASVYKFKIWGGKRQSEI